MIIKKMRSRSHSRMKNSNGNATHEGLPNFDNQRNENHKNRSQNNGRNFQQLFDKYTNMAREALSSGDRVAAEFHYQYADHYLRLMNERQQQRSYPYQERGRRPDTPEKTSDQNVLENQSPVSECLEKTPENQPSSDLSEVLF